MAHKKGQGSSRNGRDSKAQFRGIKRYAGQYVTAGTILVRQCGTRFRPGVNVKCGNDYSLFSLINGQVKFENNRRISVYTVSEKN